MRTSKSLKACRSYHWSLDHTQIHLLLIRFQNQDYMMMPFPWATTSLCFLCSWYPTNTHIMRHITFARDFPAYTENRTGTLGNMLPQARCYIYPARAMTSAGCTSSAIGKLARNLYPQLFLHFTFFFFAQRLSAKNYCHPKTQTPSWQMTDSKSWQLKRAPWCSYSKVLFLNPEPRERAWGLQRVSVKQKLMGAQVHWTDIMAKRLICFLYPTNTHFIRAWFASLE